MTEEQLSALLRIKRYEQPPAEYFDQLLRDIHRRQRSELIRRPLWKIAAERVQTFFGEHSMGHLSYAGAMAAVLVVGVTSIGLMTPGGGKGMQKSDIAKAGGGDHIAPPAADGPMLSLASTSAPKLEAPSFPTSRTGFAPVVHQPRYVIDARPVSYEPPSSFNF